MQSNVVVDWYTPSRRKRVGNLNLRAFEELVSEQEKKICDC